MFNEMIKHPKRTDGEWVFNDQEMLSLCIWAYEAEQAYRDRGLNNLSREADEFQKQVHAILVAIGYFKDILSNGGDCNV